MKEKIKEHKIEIIAVLLLMTAAFWLLPNTSPLSNQSVLHITNDYFNFTKSMMNGQVLYKDLFDHKGLFLFMLYTLPVMISDTSFIGVFLFEGIVSAGIALACYVCCRYRSSSKMAVFITAIVVLILKVCFPQNMLNTEPLCIIIMFALIHYIDTEKYKEMNQKDYAVFGLLFGALFWMKYPMVIVLFPFWLYILIYAVKSQKVYDFIKNCCTSVAVVLFFTCLVLVYFIRYDAILGIADVYFGKVDFSLFSMFLSGSTIEYSVLALLLLALIGALAGKQKKDSFLYICFLFIFYLTNNAGIRTYTASFIVVLFAVTFHYLFVKKWGRVVFTFFITFLLVMNIPFMKTNFDNSLLSIREIAEKYHTTNENTLYIGEDAGLGSYSDEPFRHKYQWNPSRINYENNKDGFESIMSYIKEHEFEFLVIKASDYDYDIPAHYIEDGHCFSLIVSSVQEHYKVIDVFEYNDGYTAKYYLCTPVN